MMEFSAVELNTVEFMMHGPNRQVAGARRVPRGDLEAVPMATLDPNSPLRARGA
jgi:hypothetical protein